MTKGQNHDRRTDKTVKYWDGDGKALKNLGRFEEIAMETRLSHDIHGSLQAIGPEKYPFGKRVTARRSDHWVETRRNFPLA